ncbi:merlin-like isoform X2 [Clytia hemisphaerica]|uniref:merlin-like isoform X2 n=1 Tax=Clytia hemisphaerica TaxID=252671 RepID=UPI0034D5009F
MAKNTNNRKQMAVHVVTKPEEELEFYVDKNIKGQELFDLVCKVRSELGEQNMSNIKLYLQVQFYPIDVDTGIIMEQTTHLFFLHVKSEILSESIYCPTEESILLASYAVQAKYGDFDSDIHKKHFLANDQLLPQRVLAQYKLSADEWEERIVKWYSQHCQGLSRYQAEMEYLKTAQNLEMYGIGYFRIQNELGTELWLGIHATGINIYESDNQLIPKVSFLWTEIKNISFKNKQIWIQPMDKEVQDFHFVSLDVAINRKILLLSSGNHDLYMRSKKEDTMEIQIMKSQAQDAREQRHREQNRLYKEIRRRIEETQARIDMEKRLKDYSGLIDEYRKHLQKAEETTDLLAEKALVAEEEAKLLLKKAADFETEIKSLRHVCNQKDEEKTYLESHIQSAQINIQQILHESNRRAQETVLLKQELDKSRHSEKMATEKLIQISNNYQRAPPIQYSSYAQHQQPPQLQKVQQQPTQHVQGPQQVSQSHLHYGGAPNYVGGDGEDFTMSVQLERVEYLEKSRHLERQLTELKTEIEGLKVAGNPDILDRIHLESVGKGETKFSTMQKLQAASTNSRVQVYQRL